MLASLTSVETMNILWSVTNNIREIQDSLVNLQSISTHVTARSLGTLKEELMQMTGQTRMWASRVTHNNFSACHFAPQKHICVTFVEIE